jgi:predicted trehalose synthase
MPAPAGPQPPPRIQIEHPTPLAGRPATEKLLSIFELEKAVYELRYELNNRPDWVRIPVAGIASLLEEGVA